MPESILTRLDYLAFLQYLNTSTSTDEAHIPHLILAEIWNIK
jgi:hypothetical protein